MITIPLKDTEKAEWADHIKAALTSIYGSPAEFISEIDAIDSMRDAMAGVSPNGQGRNILYRYFAQIDMMSLHIPMKPFKTEFTWKNAFDKNKTTQSSVAFEKACVLFNLGSTLSHLGSEASSAKDFKSAYHWFSCAAGMFKFASENFLHAPCVDVEPDTFIALSKLMLAQAQECFFLKAKDSGTAPGLLAKLAEGAASMYDESAELVQALYDEHWWCSSSLIEEIHHASITIKLDAHMCQYQHLEKLHKVGDAIAHLQKVKQEVTDKTFVEDVKAKIKSLEKDNDIIYHERVPSSAPEIPETIVAKPLSFDSIYPNEDQARKVVGKDLFGRIIHISVHEKASLYSEMKAQFLRDQIEKSEIAKLELTSALEYMDLPAAITRLKQNSIELVEVPADVIEYSLTVSSHINPFTKYGIRTDFKEQRDRIMSLLRSQQSNNDPQAVESIQRTKQGLLNVSKIDSELDNLMASINNEGELDILSDPKRIESKYKNEATSASSTSKTKSAATNLSLLDLDDDINDGGSGSTDSSFSGKLEFVSDLVAKLQKIMKERNTSLSDLREKVHNDDITEKISSYQNDMDNIEKELLQPELDKFSSYTRRIDATIRLQKAVLNDLVERWKTLLASKDAQAVLSERESVIDATNSLSDKLRDSFQQWSMAFEMSKQSQGRYAQLEREALNVGGGSSGGFSSSLRTPAVPPKPPKQSPDPGMNGYNTPSAYDPSMYN